jgi:tetratricopeptide (TPR) repeat protein
MKTKSFPVRRSFLSTGLAAALALSAGAARADLDLPRPSPFAKVWQVVGLTEITVDYSSPGVKGRKIWGGLVPYDQMWRAGANTATKVTFSKNVTFAGKPVAAGSYAFFVIPGKNDWTVILNKKTDQSGTGRDYKQAEDLLRVSVKPKAAPFRERLAYLVTDFTDDKASLDLEWEKLRLSIPITVDTGPQAVASINAAVDGTWRTYANAARYMLENKKDYDTGMKYADQSLALKQDWFNLWIKAELLAAKGDVKDALTTGEKAYEIGSKSENFFLEGEIKKTLGEWKKKMKA